MKTLTANLLWYLIGLSTIPVVGYLSGHLRIFGEGPFGFGRLFCIW